MRILALADLHLSERRPMCRLETENWIDTIADKIIQVCTAARENKVDYIVIAGDLFDLPARNSNYFMCECIKWFTQLRSSCNLGIITIPGNHDLITNDNTQLKNTSYGLLKEIGLFTDSDTFSYMPYHTTNVIGDGEIIIAHQGLYYKEKPFSGADESSNVSTFIKNHVPDNCKLFITGHFHVPFTCRVGDTVVVNCGSMMRLRADQIDYTPSMHILDYTDGKIKAKHIPFALKNEIRRDYIDSQTEAERHLEELVGSIDGDFEVTLGFRENFCNLVSSLENKDKLIEEFERCLK